MIQPKTRTVRRGWRGALAAAWLAGKAMTICSSSNNRASRVPAGSGSLRGADSAETTLRISRVFELGGKRGSKTLVLADSPNKLTGMATLKKAIAQRDNLMGGWDRVVVLGWNFEPSIGETITALNDARLEVLVIPPDLMDRLKKKGGIDKLRGQGVKITPEILRIADNATLILSLHRELDGMREDAASNSGTKMMLLFWLGDTSWPTSPERATLMRNCVIALAVKSGV